MASGSEHLRPNLHGYLGAHATPPDPLRRELITETAGPRQANGRTARHCPPAAHLQWFA